MLPTRFVKKSKLAEKVVRDANLSDAAARLGCQMASAPEEIRLALAAATQTPHSVLQQRTLAIAGLRKIPASAWSARFAELAALESETANFFKPSSEDLELLQEDSLGELAFSHRLLRPLNHVPFLVLLVSLYKVWVVPAMAIVVPILAWFLPYLLLKFVWHLPISADQYGEILQHLWAGQFTVPPMGYDATGRPALPSMWTPRSIAQFLFFGFSFVQSLMQPIQTARHLHTTSGVISGLGAKLLRIQELRNTFAEECRTASIPFKFHDTLATLEGLDPHAAFMVVYDQPERLQMILDDFARLEILWRIAGQKRFTPVTWIEGGVQPQMSLEEVGDLSLDEPVPSTVSLVGPSPHQHAVLTGPNGGGKSSFLRAALQAALFAHAYGFVPARGMRTTRFAWIASGLNLHDTPGRFSMFETEVKFAADLFSEKRRAAGAGLVLFDELFHSTNPPDGTRTAEVFLDRLWAQQHIASLVSTHVFSLIEKAPKEVQRLCCQATDLGAGRIQFSYAVEEGICRVSSVRQVWERFGLVSGTA